MTRSSENLNLLHLLPNYSLILKLVYPGYNVSLGYLNPLRKARGTAREKEGGNSSLRVNRWWRQDHVVRSQGH